MDGCRKPIVLTGGSRWLGRMGICVGETGEWLLLSAVWLPFSGLAVMNLFSEYGSLRDGLEEDFLPHKGSLHELDRIQNHIAKATGLAKRPVINTVIRAEEETAANPAQLQPLQAKTLPAWRQAVNLAAAGLWTWLAVWLLRLAADSIMRDNRQTAEKTAKQISRATGLPLLEYVSEDREGAT